MSMNIKDIVSGLKFKCCRSLKLKERLGTVDRGILKVAFMIAALDGDVTDDEYAAFDALAKQCRGYTPENAAEALDEAMRSAGYLMLLSRRVKTGKLVRAFIDEARKALPDGFAYYSLSDVRRAIVTWMAVGMSDGEYSARERACIEALRREFAELVIKRGEEDERRAMLSPAFRMAYGKRVALVDEDFVTRVEKLAVRYGDTDEAARALQKLIRA